MQTATGDPTWAEPDPSVPPRVGETAPPTSRLRYVPGLDGFRALSVTAVLLYHADVTWMPGGFLGVDVFFVISGYLITSLLLAEYRNRGDVNLGQFYLRRARRLLPALFLVLAAVSLFSVIFLPDEVRSLRGDVVAASGTRRTGGRSSSTSRTSPRRVGHRCCATSGRSRSRSSSTCCGR